MTPNKLPPLPEPGLGLFVGNNRIWFTADQMHAYAAEALRQSQSLPAGAVDEEKTFFKSCGCVFCDLKCNHSAEECSLQADAREKGELQAKIDALMLEYCPDEMTPEQVANWAAHQVAVAKPEHDAVLAALATQPAQASEKVVEVDMSPKQQTSVSDSERLRRAEEILHNLGMDWVLDTEDGA